MTNGKKERPPDSCPAVTEEPVVRRTNVRGDEREKGQDKVKNPDGSFFSSRPFFPLKIILFSIFLNFHPSPTTAAFKDIGAGARQVGMGSAFTGLADDIRTIAVNPAGLANLRRNALAADYGRLFPGLDDDSTLSTGFVAFAKTIRLKRKREERIRILKSLAFDSPSEGEKGSAEKSWEGRRDRSLDIVRNFGSAGIALSNLSLSGAVSQNTIYFSYARHLTEIFSAGLSMKLLHQKYLQDAFTRLDPVFNYGDRNSLLRMSFDAGFLLNVHPDIFVGLAISDFTRPDISLSPDNRELKPIGLKLGMGLKKKHKRGAIDLIYQEKVYRLHAGAERWFRHERYAIRCGGGFGFNDDKHLSAGMTGRLGHVQIDYAYVYPIGRMQEITGQHRISLVYRFGIPSTEGMELGSLEMHYSKLKKEVGELRAKLDKSEYEKARLEQELVHKALSPVRERMKEREPPPPPKATVRKTATRPKPKRRQPVSKVITYVTADGDTLRSISKMFFGTEKKWIHILNLNREKVGRGGRMKPGTVLIIPLEEEKIELPSQPLVKPRSVSVPARKRKKAATPRQKSYTVIPGDTLRSISEKVYGDPERWREIYRANKNKVERGSVIPGTVLTLP